MCVLWGIPWDMASFMQLQLSWTIIFTASMFAFLLIFPVVKKVKVELSGCLQSSNCIFESRDVLSLKIALSLLVTHFTGGRRREPTDFVSFRLQFQFLADYFLQAFSADQSRWKAWSADSSLDALCLLLSCSQCNSPLQLSAWNLMWLKL